MTTRMTIDYFLLLQDYKTKTDYSHSQYHLAEASLSDHQNAKLTESFICQTKTCAIIITVINRCWELLFIILSICGRLRSCLSSLDALVDVHSSYVVFKGNICNQNPFQSSIKTDADVSSSHLAIEDCIHSWLGCQKGDLNYPLKPMCATL